MKKKLLSLFVAVFMVFNLFTPSILYADEITTIISLSNVEGEKGNEVFVTISLKNYVKCSALQFDINYDSEKLDLVDTIFGSGLKSGIKDKNSIKAGKYRFTYASIDEITKSPSEVLKLKFVIKGENAEKTNISLSNIVLSDYNGIDISYKVEGGEIKINKKLESNVIIEIPTTTEINKNDIIILPSYEEPTTSAIVTTESPEFLTTEDKATTEEKITIEKDNKVEEEINVVDTVNLDKVKVTKKLTIKKGKKSKIEITLPKKIDKIYTVTYISKNKKIATVNKNGNVTAKKVGTVNIKTKIKVGNKTKTFTTKVKVVKK